MRQDVVKRCRGIAGDDQRAVDIANVKRTGHDPQQAHNAGNPRQKKRGEALRLGIRHHNQQALAIGGL
jgi:hypothetical protein